MKSIFIGLEQRAYVKIKYHNILDEEIVKELKIRERQKLVLRRKGEEIIICDWKK